MSAPPSFHFDPRLDVLSAQLPGTEVNRAKPSPSDSRMILEFDARGRVVGVELLNPTEMLPAFWSSHPDRERIPRDLLVALDVYLQDLWSSSRLRKA